MVKVKRLFKVLALGFVLIMLVVIFDSTFFIFHRIYSSGKFVSINKLLNDPQNYANNLVCTVGDYTTGFEVSSLGSKRNKVGIWISTNEVYDSSAKTSREFVAKIVSETYYKLAGVSSPSDDSFQYSTRRVFVCGHFRTGNQYGHLEGYLYELSN